ncbi:MAG TPA: DUF5666 domain-containing protein [Ktedonobacterales bacterium]|nr:DUF5666 domain-containing protein [Ktedonobacterales bacterium]
MLSKLSLLVKSKVALAAIGAVLVAGGGSAAVAAATGHLSVGGLPNAASTHAPDASSAAGAHAHTVALEGTLKGYDSGAATISVLGINDTTATTICVDSKTEVSGEHATKLSDLTAAVGHKVQVQATKPSSGSCALLAWKVTVEAADNSGGTGGSGSGQGSGHAQKTMDGAITSVGSGSFAIKLSDGTTETVTVSTDTRFAGRAHSLADLKTGDKVVVVGTDQGGGVLAAMSVTVVGS